MPFVVRDRPMTLRGSGPATRGSVREAPRRAGPSTEIHLAVLVVRVHPDRLEEHFRALGDGPVHTEPGEQLLHLKSPAVHPDGLVPASDHPRDGCCRPLRLALATEDLRVCDGGAAEQPTHRGPVLDVEQFVGAGVAELDDGADPAVDVVGHPGPLEGLVGERLVREVAQHQATTDGPVQAIEHVLLNGEILVRIEPARFEHTGQQRLRALEPAGPDRALEHRLPLVDRGESLAVS